MERLYSIPQAQLRRTFEELRLCGKGTRECQVLWTSSWDHPQAITAIVHPEHTATAVGFELDGQWLTALWRQLYAQNAGVRVQVHTHPGSAFHSQTDDSLPLIHTPGFLSLVIPNFAMGEIGFEGAYLAERTSEGGWQRVEISERLEVIP